MRWFLAVVVAGCLSAPMEEPGPQAEAESAAKTPEELPDFAPACRGTWRDGDPLRCDARDPVRLEASDSIGNDWLCMYNIPTDRDLPWWVGYAAARDGLSFGLAFDLQGASGQGWIFDILHPEKGPWIFDADDTGFVALPGQPDNEWYYVGAFTVANGSTPFPAPDHWLYYEVDDPAIAGKIRAYGDGTPLWLRIYYEGWNWADINPWAPEEHPQMSSTWSTAHAGQLIAPDPPHTNTTIDVPLIWSVYDPLVALPLEAQTCVGTDALK